MEGSFVADSQPVFKAGAIEPLMQAVFDTPIFTIVIQKSFGSHLAGRAAGGQIFDLDLPVLLKLTVQAADLRCPRQAQLHRLNLSGGQSPPFPSAAIVLHHHYLRGERSPAGDVGLFLRGRLGCP